MSRRNREKRLRKRQSEHDYSGIDLHTQRGKLLVPPMMTVPNVELISWRDNRLPEILWAAILITHLPRNMALSIFRRVAVYGRNLRRERQQAPGDITHSGLARIDVDQARELIGLICTDDYGRHLLASLTLLDELPAQELWQGAIGKEQHAHDWGVLQRAVAATLNHQSQEATDCRWLKVMFLALKGQLVFPAAKFEREIDELLDYPDVGDMGKVRPSVRALEGAISLLPTSEPTDWPARFLMQCLRDTPCWPLQLSSKNRLNAGTTTGLITAARSSLVEHANRCRQTTATDAKHDVTFGTGLFALNSLQDLLHIGIGQSILGRLGLRTLLECYVTLAYLAKLDSPELWNSYRIYGAGQAKLAFMKLDETQDMPQFVNLETLEALANEDMWQEYISVDLGHWDKSNLRALSERAGIKEDYDKYYPWTSTYTHGHWAALRDSVFTICGNPLHRLHRIPREGTRTLEDVIPDACALVDRILAIVNGLYGGPLFRITAGRSAVTPILGRR